MNTLRMQVGILAFGPFLPALFGGPFPVEAAKPVMAAYQVSPQPGSLGAGRGENAPLGLGAR